MPDAPLINYLEIPVKDIPTAKTFFGDVFGWSFVDYGPDYAAIQGAGIDAGMFTTSDENTPPVRTSNGSVLVVFKAEDLKAIEQAVVDAGGTIHVPVFDFPGGWRFHFLDPVGNEFAIWSENAPG